MGLCETQIYAANPTTPTKVMMAVKERSRDSGPRPTRLRQLVTRTGTDELKLPPRDPICGQDMDDVQ